MISKLISRRDFLRASALTVAGAALIGCAAPTAAPTAAPVEEEPVEEEEAPIIARRKRFVLEPMNEYEAVEQMTMLGHENFFMFFNVNTSAINVLYRRRDGTYGLIEPEAR